MRAGLICLTGGPDGPINEALVQAAATLARAPPGAPRGDCSAIGSMSNCSATAPRMSGWRSRALIDLAYELDLPLVATNEPYFASPMTMPLMMR